MVWTVIVMREIIWFNLNDIGMPKKWPSYLASKLYKIREDIVSRKNKADHENTYISAEKKQLTKVLVFPRMFIWRFPEIKIEQIILN